MRCGGLPWYEAVRVRHLTHTMANCASLMLLFKLVPSAKPTNRILSPHTALKIDTRELPLGVSFRARDDV